MSRFETDTAVTAVDGGWASEVHAGWNVGTKPNGGYTLALTARAMLEASGRPDPLSVTAHYVAPPSPGPVTVNVETVRAGRRYATLAATLRQDDGERIRVIGAFGDLGAMEGPTRVGTAAPPVAPPERCIDLQEASAAGGIRPPEVANRYDLRIDPDSQWLRARMTDPGAPENAPVDGPLEVNGWIRFADGAQPSVLGLLAQADAFPPTLIGYRGVGWIPTIELTVHVRGRPAPGWILGSFRTRFLINGLLEEDGELWDSDGRLVALCRQLALVLPRR